MKYYYTGPTSQASAPPRRATKPYAHTRQRVDRRAAFNTNNEERKTCLCCKGEHNLLKCPKFGKMNTEERWEVIKGSGYCFKCLTQKHRRYQCKAKACTEDGCGRPNHPLLHTKIDTTPEKETVWAPNGVCSWFLFSVVKYLDKPSMQWTIKNNFLQKITFFNIV